MKYVVLGLLLAVPALADWRITPKRNSRFRAEVWQRVEAAQLESSWRGYLRAHGPEAPPPNLI